MGEDKVLVENDYRVEEDYYKVKRFFEKKAEVDAIFADEERLKKLKEFAKKKKETKENTHDAIESGNYQSALGLKNS